MGLLDGNKTVFNAVRAGKRILTTDESTERSVIRSGCCGFAHQHSYGLSIYFPWSNVSRGLRNLTSTVAQLGGERGQGWLKFLKQHVAETRREPRFNDD